MKHQETTQAIIEAFYAVYNTLGYGFLEKVYEEALACELAHRGLVVQQQEPIEVFYRDKKVGDYFADILVNETVIIEVKAVESLGEKHRNFSIICVLPIWKSGFCSILARNRKSNARYLSCDIKITT